VDQLGLALEDVAVFLGVAGGRVGARTPSTSQSSFRNESLLARSAAPDAAHFFTKASTAWDISCAS
jgi:hypothetical protein